MTFSIASDSSPYGMVYYGFRLSGLISDKGKPWSVIYTAYHWFIINSFAITSVLELCYGSGKLQDVIETLSCVAVYIMTFSKSVVFLTRDKEILSLLSRLEETRLQILEDPENRCYIKKAESDGKKLITIVTAFLVSTPVLSFIFTTIYDYMSNFENKRLIVQVWIPWSMESVGPYIFAKFVASLMSLSTVVVYSAFASIEFTFTFQMSAYLRTLQNYLRTKGPKDKRIYKRHKVLSQLIKDYNGIFSGQTYLETLISPIMPCGFGLTLIRALRKKELNQFDSLQKMACCLLPPLIVCSCGQEIITQVERLHEASYMNEWYNEKPSVRRDLLMLMVRTTKPVTMHYRMFMNFDHVRLANVLQGLYSYFMLIINFSR